MRKLVLAALSATLLIGSVPAFAQVGVDVGPGGVGVEVGRDRDRDYRRDREYRRDRYDGREYRDRDRVEVIRRRGDCRTTTVRTERPDGDVVVRRVRRCD